MESIDDFKFNKRDLNFLIKLKARDFLLSFFPLVLPLLNYSVSLIE